MNATVEVYIRVKNFGAIEEARINISNFTIFVGNNNSGKTQLMELIYSIVKYLSAQSPNIMIPQINTIDAFHLGKEEIISLNQWVNQHLNIHIHKIIEETFNTFIPIEEIQVEFENINYNYDIYLLTDRTVGDLLKENIITQEILTHSLLDKTHYYHAFITKNNDDGIEKHIMNTRFSNTIPIEIAKNIQIGYILGEIMGGKSPISSNLLFLPASRMGLMLLYKHYFGNTSQDKEEVIRNKSKNPKGITKPVLDFLSFLLKYSYTDRVAKNNEELLHFIFHHLIDGRINETGETTVYIPKNQENEIPVFVASSMVNEVVPVVKALTDSDEINFIFYDEVETSMHPLKQIEMVKLLNRLNNRGIKLLVSTHSDTMATKINNLLLLSQENYNFEENQKMLIKNGISLQKEDLITPENVHVYQFINKSGKKSIITELDFKKIPCTGYDFSLFNDSTMTLFDEAKIAMGINNEN